MPQLFNNFAVIILLLLLVDTSRIQSTSIFKTVPTPTSLIPTVPNSTINPQHEAYARAMLDQIHQQFIAVVRQGRGKALKESPDTFSGLFWNGEQAIKLGLADRTGSLDQVARDVVKAEDIVDYTEKENLAERLAKRFGAAIGSGAVQAMRSSVSMR